MRLPIVRRAVGIQARGLLLELVRIDERRRQLERVDAEGLLDDFSDLRRQRAGERLRRARGAECRSAPDSGSAARAAPELSSRAPRVAEQQRQHVGRRQMRIRVQRRPASARASRRSPPSPDRSARHPHVVSASTSKNGSMRVGIGEIHRSAGDPVAPPFERHLAAIDVGVTRDHRPIVGAAQLEVGIRDHPHEVVLDAQRRGHQDLRRRTSAGTPTPARRRSRAGACRRATVPARSKMLPGVSMRRFQSGVLHGHDAG